MHNYGKNMQYMLMAILGLYLVLWFPVTVAFTNTIFNLILMYFICVFNFNVTISKKTQCVA